MCKLLWEFSLEGLSEDAGDLFKTDIEGVKVLRAVVDNACKIQPSLTMVWCPHCAIFVNIIRVSPGWCPVSLKNTAI